MNRKILIPLLLFTAATPVAAQDKTAADTPAKASTEAAPRKGRPPARHRVDRGADRVVDRAAARAARPAISPPWANRCAA